MKNQAIRREMRNARFTERAGSPYSQFDWDGIRRAAALIPQPSPRMLRKLLKGRIRKFEVARDRMDRRADKTPHEKIEGAFRELSVRMNEQANTLRADLEVLR
jgi:hypothetical protein